MKRNNWPETLLAWFDGSRRALPWREDHPRNPSAYDIMVFHDN